MLIVRLLREKNDRVPIIIENIITIFLILEGQGMDGYTLMNRTGLSKEDLTESIREILKEINLIIMEGEFNQIGKAYFCCKPGISESWRYRIGVI